MLRSRCLALLIFVGVFVGCAAADVQTGMVRSGGQPIPGATVSAECGTDKITTTTDDAGRFEMGGLPSTSCKYTVLMFGFEPVQKEAAASSTPLSFDVTLQAHASIPVAPSAAPVAAATPVAPAAGTATPPPAAPATPDLPRPSLTEANGRGARGAASATGRNGRGGQAANTRGQAAAGRGAQTGFQNLSLVQNEDAPAASDAPASTLGGDSDAAATASGDAFTVNGTLSQGVQAQAGDGFGMGGPGGFGFGAGGPGGDALGGGGFGGPGGDGGGRGGAGGGARGAGGPGGGRGGGAGGFGGPGGGGFAGGGGARGAGGRGGRGGGRGGPNGTTSFGNRAGRGRGPQYQASLSYNFANSALNARPYSLKQSSIAPEKAATANNLFGITLGGPIAIPKTKFNLKNSRFNINYRGDRERNGVDTISSVPTAAMRGGDFSALSGTTTIYDPSTGTPFANNIIPTSRISPVASALLNYYPAPTGLGLKNNYELIATNPNNTNNLNVQLSDPMTAKDRINVNLAYQSRDSARVQSFGFIDPTSGSGGSVSLSYARTFSPTMVNTLTFAVNRNLTNNLSYFSNGADVADDLGISGILATPLTYGPPTLGFSNFSNLTDGTPSTNHSTTFSLTDGVTKVKGKHNISVGVTGSKRESNTLSASNARGSFSFTGAETQLASNTQNTGYDLADYLLGMPASTSVVQYLNSNNMFYYRQNQVAAYAVDDWRATTKLTVNAGLRWEFYSPETEKNGRMANLAFSPDGTQVQYVTPGQANPFGIGGSAPTGLINPDYKLFEPQVGIAAKPWSKRPIVIRAGYGIRFNGSALAQQAAHLAAQPPFLNTISLSAKQTPGITLQNGFTSTQTTFLNTYGVDPNYKPAMAQQWNAIVQYTLGRSYVAQLSYYGIKGSDLDVLLGPNRAPANTLTDITPLVPIPNALTNIEFDRSIGNSIYHAGSAQITRRFARGIAGSVTYTLAKAIDDSSTLGGGVVQIENNIAAERAVTATVPHHNLAVTFNYQTLVGNQKSQFYWNFLRGWQLLGRYNVNSGRPFTATVSGDPSNSGIIGSARAEATGLPVDDGDGYFNPLAFSVPATGTYGDAGRNTIPGIVNFTMSASAMRSFRFGDRHRLALTFTAVNPLNHPSITGIYTVIGNATIVPGTPSSAGDMRSVTAQARFTF